MTEIIIAILVTVVGGLILQILSPTSFQQLVKYFKMRKFKKERNGNIIFISSGGTCRDPMAAAITKNMFHNAKMDHIPQIYARALGPISKSEVSFAARKAIQKLLGKDLLEGHVPETISKEEIEKADLLLVMDKSLLIRKTLPEEKTYLLKEFFGQEGDIVDPWPDGKDENTLIKYFETARELQDVIDSGFKKLVNAIR